MFKKIIILMLTLVCLLSVSAISAADTNNEVIVAVADSPGNFTELANTINSANGTLDLTKNYTNTDNYKKQGIDITKNIIINGNGYTIDAQGKSRIFNIADGVSVTLKNLTFINGKAADRGTANYGGAIYNQGDLIVENCQFKDTTAKSSGGAIYTLNEVSVIVRGSNFTNITSGFDGGAVYIDEGSLSVMGSNFTNITSEGDGGAVYMFDGIVVVTDSNFKDTKAQSGGGGAISTFGGSINVIGSTFNNTTSDNGGAIYTFEDVVTVIDSKFEDTKAQSGGGGAISTFGGSVTVVGSTFNSTNANGTAVIYIKSNNVNLTNNTIESNLLAIYNDGSKFVSPISLTFSNVTVEEGEKAILTAVLTDDKGNIIGSKNNVAAKVNSTPVDLVFNETTNKFTAVYNETTVKGTYTVTGTYSKAINCAVNNGTLTVNENIPDFKDLQDIIDAATPNSVIYLNGTYYTAKPGQSNVIINKSITIIGGSEVNPSLRSTLDAKGQSRIFDIDYGVSVTLNNITFTNGQDVYDGGAIYNQGNLIVEDCQFKNTIVTNTGGAICSFGTLTVLNSTFINTTATKEGGAIYYGSYNDVTVLNSTFINTTATKEGGAIYSSTSSTLTVIDSNFIDNYADGQGASILSQGVLNVKDSTFNSTTVNGTAIIYIKSYNKSANLTNNTINSFLIPIYNNGGNIISPTKLNFDNVTCIVSRNATLTATLTDDKGNLIGSKNNVIGKVNDTDVTFVFNETTRKFTVEYQPSVKGEYIITGNYSKATDCNVNNGTLTVGEIAKIYAPSIVKYYKNGTQFIVKVTENDSPIVGSQVEITINGVTYNRTTDMNGTAKLNINLVPGEYDVNVSAIGSFGELTTNSTVTVLPTIEGNDTVLYYRNGTKYNAIFLDEQGNPLNNTVVTFNINGVTYERTTNENGTTSGLNINLAPGEYIITATNPVNGEMHSNNITVLPTIETNNLVKYYKNGTQFVAKALDKQGQAIAGQTVKFNINGVIYTRTTDDNGEAKLNINLAAGNSEPEVYVITTECNGCTVSNTVTVLPVIIGDDMELQYHSGEKYNVNVFDGQGNPQPNVNVTININGVNYHRTSNSEGTTTGLTINLQPGKYIITAIRDDNGATISNNIVVTE